jgi:tetratricopeptide (TPR) repeat protein
MSGRAGRVLALALAVLTGPATAATDYWAYEYKNIDVTVAGSASYAQHVARNADRLATALGQILSFRGGDPPLPTHIYVLPDEQIVELLGSTGSANYSSSGYDATIIASRGPGSGEEYWGVYFGYVGSLLAGDRAERYPYWFRLGVPEVFASTEFDHDRAKTGGLAYGYALTVASGKLIPLRTFLALKEQDPQLQTAAVGQMYAAESWFLTREILVEGRYREEFSNYLALVQQGKSSPAAFAASFKVGYEVLDRMLRADQRVTAHIFLLSSPEDRRPDTAPPRKLAPPEVEARLALVDLKTGRRAEALRRALAALKDDPTNERALRVVAEAQLEQGDYPASFAAVDRLSAGALSPEGMADCAGILTVLASAVIAGHVVLPVDAPTLLKFVQRYYQGAIEANPEDLRSWAGLAGFYGAQRDAAAAQALLPGASQALSRHPGNVNLAYALAHMCAQTQQWDCALKFAAAWRENALTEANRADAAAFEARLTAYRQRLASAPAADASAPPVHN